MKFLFNATTNLDGGGAKNSALFLRFAATSNIHDWHFAVSPQVAEVAKSWDVPPSRITVFETSPARSIRSRNKLLSLQHSLEIDLVYTMAGPAYTRFSCMHVMGISNPYISHVDAHTFLSTRSALKWPVDLMRTIYQSYYATVANRLVFQTHTARDNFCRRLKYPIQDTVVIPNAFDSQSFSHVASPSLGNPARVLVPAVAYPHKLLDQVPLIAAAYHDLPDARPAEFVLTLDQESAEWASILKRAKQLNVSALVKTIGRYNYADAGRVFAQSDLVLSLSVLETFSATPLEAFASGRPFICADRPWSKEISREAAVYVEPRNPDSVARAVSGLIHDEKLRAKLTDRGREILNTYDDQSARFSRITDMLEQEARHHAL